MADTPFWLLYDGACPLCSRYVIRVRLRESLGPLMLANMRERPDLVTEVRYAGLDPNSGMILRIEGRYYHGADCLNVLALLSTSVGWFNRLNAVLFRSPRMSRISYPVMVAGRRLLLTLLHRQWALPR